jgi:secreted protein with Ig-like and vWFA domain
MPYLKSKLEEWGITEIVISTSFNKIGYLMSPDRDSYINAAKNNDNSKYQLIAMSTLASGAIPAIEAYEFINQQNVQSVVFGASSERHIKETLNLIKLK